MYVLFLFKIFVKVPTVFSLFVFILLLIKAEQIFAKNLNVIFLLRTFSVLLHLLQVLELAFLIYYSFKIHRFIFSQYALTVVSEFYVNTEIVII